MPLERSSEWIRQGQAHEGKQTASDLAEAVRCYDRALALLRAEPAEQVQHALGVACMNRGNALQKQAAHHEAVRAYDEAIGHLQNAASSGDHSTRNSLGAAWMNRGHALQSLGTPAALADADHSHGQAITVLQSLPLNEDRSHRINLSAAWMNRAHTLLAFPQPDATAARTAAATALTLTNPSEQSDELIAGIALSARHAHCAALALLLAASKTFDTTVALVAETGDSIDEAMGFIRHWTRKQPAITRPLAGTLYRFGAQFYLVHQSRFLTEFLLENLDPTVSPDAIPGSAELYAIAAQTIAQALADNYNLRLTTPTASLLQENARTLHAAEKRLETLRAQTPVTLPTPA